MSKPTNSSAISRRPVGALDRGVIFMPKDDAVAAPSSMAAAPAVTEAELATVTDKKIGAARARVVIENSIVTAASVFNENLPRIIEGFIAKGCPAKISEEEKKEIFTKKRREMRADVGYVDERGRAVSGNIFQQKNFVNRFERGATGLGGEADPARIYARCIMYRLYSYLSDKEHWMQEAIRFKNAKRADEARRYGVVGLLVRGLGFTTSDITAETFEFSDSLLEDPTSIVSHLNPAMPFAAKISYVDETIKDFFEQIRTTAVTARRGSGSGVRDAAASRLSGADTSRTPAAGGAGGR